MSDKHGSEVDDYPLRRSHRRRLDSCFSDDFDFLGFFSEKSFARDQDDCPFKVPQEYLEFNAHEEFIADECPICKDRDERIEKTRERLLLGPNEGANN